MWKEALLKLRADDNSTMWAMEGEKDRGGGHQEGILKLSRPGADLE